MAENDKLKMAIIAGATHAAKFKEKNPYSTEAEVVKHVSKEADKILEQIDEELK